jgi:hypothetical protein
MANDDVKVKFGGDFTDVATGAQAATKQAGAALSSWYGEFSKSMSSSILGSLALSSIFGKFTSGISEALHYFRELDLTMRRIGGSGAEFQQLAGIGKQVGVSMEGVGRSLNFFNKYVGQAAQGSKAHAESLMKMGYTQDQIKKGEISAIEIISKLGDEYDQTGNDTIVAAKAMEYFGRQGSQLIPIIKMGREEIQNLTKDMKVYSEETIRRLSETEHRMEKFKKTLEKVFYKAPLVALGSAQEYLETKAVYQGALGNAQQMGGAPERQALNAYNFIKSEAGENVVMLRDFLKMTINSLGRANLDPDFVRTVQALQANLSKEIDRIEKAPKKEAAVEQPVGTAALTASSLQAIGGGDIASIYAGVSVQEAQLAAQEQTAANTGVLASKVKEGVTPTPAANVAK